MKKNFLVLLLIILTITSCSTFVNNADLVSLKEGDIIKYDFISKNSYNTYIKGYKWIYINKEDGIANGQKIVYEVTNVNLEDVDLSVTAIESSGAETKKTSKVPVSRLIMSSQDDSNTTGMIFKAFEKVTVPFGTFDSLKVANENSAYGSLTFWFVKDIGLVKIEIKNSILTTTTELEYFSK